MRRSPCHRANSSPFPRVCLAALLALLFLASALSAAAQSPSVPVFNPANGHWYQAVRVPNGIIWPDARAAAESMFFAGYRGHLATITSAQENQFVVFNVFSIAGAANDTFLGGYQDLGAPDYREPAGGWRWVTGEPWVYTSWHLNQPDNSNGGTPEHVLETTASGTWNDFPTGFTRSAYLVEFEPPASPGAVTISILPNPVVAGQTTIGQLTLNRPAGPADVLVSLASSDAGVAAVPAVVIVSAGATSALFSIVTFPVSKPTDLTLTATGPGGSRMAMLRVLPAGSSLQPGNLLVNGSFEQPRVPRGAPDALTLREKDALPGWRITRGTVDLVLDPTWQSAPGEGTQGLDLVGSPGAGTIEQSLPTVPGREYLFSGWVAHHPDNPVAPEGRADVLLNGQFFVQLFHRDAQATRTELRWTRFVYRFRATAATTTLSLADATNTWEMGGLFLDGLAVTPVPGNLLLNGSFEEPDVADIGNGIRAIGPGGLPGWQVGPGYVELIHQRAWQPAPGQGSQSLHLIRSTGSGSIEQSIPTEPGRTYTLFGWLSHNPNVAEGQVGLFLNGEFTTSLLHSGALYGATSRSEMRWQPFLVLFRASGPTTSLRFVDTTGRSDAAGAVLDGLVVVPAEAPPVSGQPPAAPTGLTVRLISPTQVDLSWTDTSSDETGFEVQRRTGTGEWTRIALLGANLTRFSDYGVSPNTAYTYRVRSQNDGGASDWSNEAGVTTLPGP